MSRSTRRQPPGFIAGSPTSPEITYRFMADKVYLAIDLGAESGRVMAGTWNGR